MLKIMLSYLKIMLDHEKSWEIMRNPIQIVIEWKNGEGVGSNRTDKSMFKMFKSLNSILHLEAFGGQKLQRPTTTSTVGNQ